MFYNAWLIYHSSSKLRFRFTQNEDKSTCALLSLSPRYWLPDSDCFIVIGWLIQVGSYEEFTDDSRLSIQKIAFCPVNETLVLAGYAGQVIILKLDSDATSESVTTPPIKTIVIDVLKSEDPYVWSGTEALPSRQDAVRTVGGAFHPVCIAQLYPPAVCTALTLHTDWKLYVTLYSSVNYWKQRYGWLLIERWLL